MVQNIDISQFLLYVHLVPRITQMVQTVKIKKKRGEEIAKGYSECPRTAKQICERVASKKQGESQAVQRKLLAEKSGEGKTEKRKGGKRMTETPFMKINDAVRATGLSAYFLRNGCKDGSVPHITSGTTYFINVPALLRKLDAESEAKA